MSQIALTMWLLILSQWEMVVRNLILLYAMQVWNRICQPPSWRIMVPKVKDIALKFIPDIRKRNGFWRWRDWWSVSSLICMIFFSISNLMFNFHEGKAKELRDVRNVTLITSSNHSITLNLVMVSILTWNDMVFRQLRTLCGISHASNKECMWYCLILRQWSKNVSYFWRRVFFINFFKVGCGVGNTVFPILEANK